MTTAQTQASRAQASQTQASKLRAPRLGQLLSYLRRNTTGAAAVAYPKASPIAGIYWPAVFDPQAPAQLWRDLLTIAYDPEGKRSYKRAIVALDQEAKDVALLPLKDPKPQHQALLLEWQQERVRTEIEKLVGPLRVHASSAFARDLMQAHVGQVKLASDVFDDAVLPAQLFKGESYLFYRPVEAHTKTLERIFAFPPLLDEVLSDLALLPPHLQLLYGALRTLFYACPDDNPPLDPHEAGLTFTKNGLVFINWPRLAASPHWPQTTATSAALRQVGGRSVSFVREGHSLHPSVLAHTLFKLSTQSPRRFKAALVEPSAASPQHLPAYHVARSGHLNTYLRLCIETGCFQYDDDYFDPCTLVDPLVLATKHDFFQGGVYQKHLAKCSDAVEARQRAAGVTPSASGDSSTSGTSNSRGKDPFKGAKIYAIPFRPWDFLQKHLEKPPWFGDGVTELVYAVKRKGGFYFTHPSLLSKELALTREGAGEIEVWCRALESLKLYERVHEEGDLLDFTNQKTQWRSRYFQRIKNDVLLRVATGLWKEITGLDQLKQRQMQQVLSRMRSQFSSDTGEHGKRWYYRLVAEATKEITTPNDVRRVLKVVLPGQEDEKPRPQHFYTPLAIDIFGRFAAVSLGLEDPARFTTDTMIQALYASLPGPAYYVYAWAQFCKQHRCSSLTSLADQSDHAPKHWTPAEDLLMLQTFRKPRMRNGAWTTLLSNLYNIHGRDITLSSAHVHITKMNALLKKALHPSTFQTLSFGGCYGPGIAEAQARSKRTVLLLGYLIHHQRVHGKVMRQLPNVLGILKRPNKDVLAVELPQTYSDPFFREFK